MSLFKKVRTLLGSEAVVPTPTDLAEAVAKAVIAQPQALPPAASHPITIRAEALPLASPNILDAHGHNGYLAGQLLVATPLIAGGPFHKSVVYLCSHSAEGAMGFIINQPVETISYGALFHGTDIGNAETMRQMPIYYGGPVERGRGFVLHTNDYFREFSHSASSELAVTTSNLILQDILEGSGPRQAALVVGCAAWAPGQLESEIEQNGWITVPASESLVFNTENELKWATASKLLGISDMAFYSTTVGHG
jgi:putative transcriptional regulator